MHLLTQVTLVFASQAVRFHKWASEQKKSEGEEESAEKKEEKKGPRSTDWRWGPAQYWYDRRSSMNYYESNFN